MLTNLPADINVELLLSYFPMGKFKVALKGLHKRNTYNDIIDMEEMDDDEVHISVGRNSLYNALPEYIFHPIDRFDNLPTYEERKHFQDEIDKQEEEIRKAYLFFAPIDVLLLKLHTDVRDSLTPLAEENIVLQQILGDSLTDEQRNNRFIRQLIPLLPSCKYIRGNRTLITLMLRKVFMEEGLAMRPKAIKHQFTDDNPYYENSLDMTLGDSYIGNTFSEMVSSYEVYYWSDDECTSEFLSVIDDIEMLRLFVKDYFIAIEEDLVFDIHHDEPPLRLNDEVFLNYLNFNTNI